MTPSTTTHPTLPEFAAALITVFEGERLMSYQDSGGVWTIGIGHTGADVVCGLTITHEQALALFVKDQFRLLQLVSGIPSIPRAAALISFGYNCGISALQHVLAGQGSISDPIHSTDRHGNVLPGLVARRRLESLLLGL